MSIEFDATYRDGSLHPDQPLHLPENSLVRVRVQPRPPGLLPVPFPTNREEVLALRPKSPRITGAQLRDLIAKHAVSVGTLPPDFSREDIYSDHD